MAKRTAGLMQPVGARPSRAHRAKEFEPARRGDRNREIQVGPSGRICRSRPHSAPCRSTGTFQSDGRARRKNGQVPADPMASPLSGVILARAGRDWPHHQAFRPAQGRPGCVFACTRGKCAGVYRRRETYDRTSSIVSGADPMAGDQSLWGQTSRSPPIPGPTEIPSRHMRN